MDPVAAASTPQHSIILRHLLSHESISNSQRLWASLLSSTKAAKAEPGSLTAHVGKAAAAGFAAWLSKPGNPQLLSTLDLNISEEDKATATKVARALLHATRPAAAAKAGAEAKAAAADPAAAAAALTGGVRQSLPADMFELLQLQSHIFEATFKPGDPAEAAASPLLLRSFSSSSPSHSCRLVHLTGVV